MYGATRVSGQVVHRDRALIGVNVAVDDDVHAVLVEQRLHRLTHQLSLIDGIGAGGIHGHVKGDHHPRSFLAVDAFGEVFRQPLVLQRPRHEPGVARQRDHQNWADLPGPVEGAGRTRAAVRSGVSHHVLAPVLAVIHLKRFTQ